MHASERCWLKFLAAPKFYAAAKAHISLIVDGILIAIGFGWFYALRWYRRSRDEDVDRRFKEILI
jgi:hypothetical protein